MGSRTEIWPATPSSKPGSKSELVEIGRSSCHQPLSANTRYAAARCCFLYSLSSSKESNFGYDRIFKGLPDLLVLPRAPTLALSCDSDTRVVAIGAMLTDVLIVMLFPWRLTTQRVAIEDYILSHNCCGNTTDFAAPHGYACSTASLVPNKLLSLAEQQP